jgi:hypothetical protein
MRVSVSSLEKKIADDRGDRDTKVMTPIRLQNNIRDRVESIARVEIVADESEILRGLIRLGLEAHDKGKDAS